MPLNHKTVLTNYKDNLTILGQSNQEYLDVLNSKHTVFVNYY
jgi:hypothetical protein